LNRSDIMFTAGKFSTNSDLVNSLQSKGLLKTETIIAAFRSVDRGAFFPSELLRGDGQVYDDKPLKIGVVHQSAPHMYACLCGLLSFVLPRCAAVHASHYMYAHILELLQVQPGHRVLNIGSGTGYLRSSLLFHSTSTSNPVTFFCRISVYFSLGSPDLMAPTMALSSINQTSSFPSVRCRSISTSTTCSSQ
jgi:hypothetical protein